MSGPRLTGQPLARRTGLRLLVLGLMVAALALAACGSPADAPVGAPPATVAQDMERYCQYKSDTQREYDNCFNYLLTIKDAEQHIADQTLSGHSRLRHAAQYAEGDLDYCLPDAGPQCKSQGQD
jgi:hypothetical protein